MKSRVLLGSILLLGTLALTACGGSPDASTSIRTEGRPVGTFNEVEVQGVGKLIISQGDTPQLIISGEDNAVTAINVDTENNRLKIRPQPGVDMKSVRQLDYQLIVKDLRMLDISGTVIVDGKDLKQPSLALKLTSANDVTLRGSGDSLEISMNGAGNYKGEAYQVKNAKVSISGPGSADVNATGQLDVSIGGVGSVYYLGSPQLNQIINGTGKIVKKSTQ